MITSPPSFTSVACLGLGPFFRSVTAGLRLFTVVPTADYRFLFIGSAAAGLCCFLLFRLFTVGQRFLFHCQVNGIHPLLPTGHCESVVSPRND